MNVSTLNGRKLGPPASRLSLPADGEHGVADRLGLQPPRGEPPEQAVVRVLRRRPSRRTCAAWRYVADVTISRCSGLSRPPESRNQAASQSSSSGWVGRSPLKPKSLGVRTSPSPKWCCQTRLTMTRHESGLSTVDHPVGERPAAVALGGVGRQVDRRRAADDRGRTGRRPGRRASRCRRASGSRSAPAAAGWPRRPAAASARRPVRHPVGRSSRIAAAWASRSSALIAARSSSAEMCSTPARNDGEYLLRRQGRVVQPGLLDLGLQEGIAAARVPQAEDDLRLSGREG